MAAVTLSGMRAAEQTALACGWTEEQLLDLAGTRLGGAIARFFPQSGTVVAYLGKGHNAGDALVALKILRDQFGWQVFMRAAFPLGDCAPLTCKKWHELGAPSPLGGPPAWRDLTRPLVLLDGLLGIGATGALRQPLSGMAEEMEWLRQNAGARVAAVDLPSGIDADSGVYTPGTVIADITFMIGLAKRGLLTAHAANATGALALVEVEPLALPYAGDIDLISPQTMTFSKSPRPFDFHKGMAGRVSLLAGSDTYTGAAVLAATGALRGGTGLITLHVPQSAAAAIASRCPPEVMVRGYSSIAELRDFSADTWVLGPGIGELDTKESNILLDILVHLPVPAVIDADALNLIARSGSIGILSKQHIITPHPGEFQRLAPDLASLPREKAARTFADRIPATLLLKGCRTLVTRSGHPLWCNATGSPGMATGGQGDLLSGVIGACLAVGHDPLEAAAFSAWLCGRAAEIALGRPGLSEESLTPSDVALHLGAACLDWKNSTR